MARSRAAADMTVSATLLHNVRELARPLATPSDLDPLLQRVGDARVVMLGEASHGTREFYKWRTAITQRLVEEKGFRFVGVEGDWLDCYRVNRYVKGYAGAAPDASSALETFRRWPTWMWANEEARELVEWMRARNEGRPEAERVGFYGLDVYGLWDSLRALVKFLKERDAPASHAAQSALRCFERFGENIQDYARATVLVPASCEKEAVDLLRRVREAGLAPKADGDEGHEAPLAAELNAMVVRNAEAYYRTMVRSDAQSWNIRDGHMTDTLDKLLDHHGPSAKAIVWAHNTHIGDARYTDMAQSKKFNLGQLGREKYGEENVVLVGFGTHRGEVIAGGAWDDPWQAMRVPEARDGSWEDVVHRATDGADALIVMPKSKPAAGELCAWRGNRAIGVVYQPHFEHLGNYVPTVLAKRYDALVFIDRTHALRPLFAPDAAKLTESDEETETYPTGV